MLDFVNGVKTKCFVYGCDVLDKDKLKCENNFILDLLNHQDIIKTGSRIWKHKKKHFTRNHYDCNLINILNISLLGKKTFWLAPPASYNLIPLTNIPYKPIIENYLKIILYPGDCIFIPACWFHCVRTDEDSINITYDFWHKDSQYFLNKRDISLMMLHKYLQTPYYHQFINKIPLDVNLKSTIFLLFKEISFITSLSICIYILFLKLNKLELMWCLYINLFILIRCFLHKIHGKLLDIHLYIFGFCLLVCDTLF